MSIRHQFLRRARFIVLCIVCIIISHLLLNFARDLFDARPSTDKTKVVVKSAESPTPPLKPALKPPTSILSADGYVRHCITGAVVGRVPGTVSKSVVTAPTSEPGINETARLVGRKERFTRIFEKRAWGEGHDKTYTGLSASGDGSTLRYAQETIGVLHTVLNLYKQEHKVDRVSLVDMSCGDMQWMSRFLETREDVDYTGFDVVPDLIAHHREKFKDRPWKFEQHDMVTDDTPLDQYDIILARHTFMHLTSPDVLRALARLSRPRKVDRPQFLLATTFSTVGELGPRHDLNHTVAGGYRPLNIEVPPISVAPAMCLAADGSRNSGQFLGLWRLPIQTVNGCSKSVVVKTFRPLRSCVDWSLPDSTKN